MKHTQTLPLSQPDPNAASQPTIRRRLSSLSLHIQPTTSSATAWALQRTQSVSSATAWALRRTQSVSSAGGQSLGSIRKWWAWGWTWVLSHRPTFAGDLEMNEEETAVLGTDKKGSLGHVLFKVRAQIRKLLGSDDVGLPQTFKYNSFNYAKNFDDHKTRSFRS